MGLQPNRLGPNPTNQEVSRVVNYALELLELIERRTKPKQIPKKRAPIDVSLPFKAIIDDLNTRCHTSYKSGSEGTQKLITARFRQGYKLEDFFVVNEVKSDEWLKNKEMRQYLRPETLYGPKFENYRNQGDVRPREERDEL